MKRRSILSILTITLTFLVAIIIIIILTQTISIAKYKNVSFYTIDDDKIPSIPYVLGKRDLYYYKSKIENDNIVKILRYKNIINPRADLSTYIDTLKNDCNYVSTSEVDLGEIFGKFQLSTNSIYVNEIITIDITYNKNSYEIKITRGPGNINMYK